MKKELFRWQDGLFTLAVLLGTYLLNLLLFRVLETPVAPSLLFVLAVFLVALQTVGHFWVLAASFFSVLIVNFAFTYPYNALDFLAPERLIAALVLFLVAGLTSFLATKLRRQEKLRTQMRLERTRADLLRAVSHDLRTPLTSIYGSASAIMENYDSLSQEQQKKLLAAIQEDSQWLIRMVENLLSVTRVGGDGVALVKTPTVVEELIDAVLLKFRKRWPEQKVAVSIPDEFVSIPMDAMLIEQVLINLLENAVDHASGMTRLSLCVTLQEGDARFSVTDDGCGIAQEKLRRLFEGYLEEGSAPSDGSRRNMGIGLSVCAAIVRAHGGAIRGENLPQGGAEFSFILKGAAENEQQ